MFEPASDDSRQGPPPDEGPHESRLASRAARLHKRGLDLSGEESTTELIQLLGAAERFEAAVGALGENGAARLSAIASPQPGAIMIPPRAADESARGYAVRLDRLAIRLQALAESE
ncbi:MAG TPA: hypothetical protein VEI06_15820 [Gemmatimonadaceae bacterium]|nr:hypothetical protein [Gemmatimonadaceae bacterium]